MTPIALAAAGWTIRETPKRFTGHRGSCTIEAEVQLIDGLWAAWFFIDDTLAVSTHQWNDRAAALDTLAERAWNGTTVGAFALGACQSGA
jgi:hypothetical protein